jgi:hypothetical protein
MNSTPRCSSTSTTRATVAVLPGASFHPAPSIFDPDHRGDVDLAQTGKLALLHSEQGTGGYDLGG